MSNDIIYPTFDQVKQVYDKTIEKSGGGLSGIRDEGGILATLDFVRNDDYYPSFTDKLSYLVYGFCHGHYFLDGNKRIALTIGVFFLLQNGYYCAAQNFMEKVEAIIYHVASGKVDRELLNEVLICVVNGFDYSDELKIDLAHRISDE
jgi:death-on-curing protein